MKDTVRGWIRVILSWGVFLGSFYLGWANRGWLGIVLIAFAWAVLVATVWSIRRSL